MAGIKTELKAAKAAIDAGRWGEAVEHALQVLSIDAENYFAQVFLGRAYDKLGKFDDALKGYESAVKLKPAEKDPYLGLRELYSSQGGKKVDQHTDVSVKIAEIFAAAEDQYRCQDAVNKLVDFARANGTKEQYARALRAQLPGTAVYDFLEGRLPHPSFTYRRLVEIIEAAETEKINKQIGERRTRLGARLGQVTAEVKREVFAESELEELYKNVIDWMNEDDVRRQFEEKLLQRTYDVLLVLAGPEKDAKRHQVMELAEGMIIIKHPYLLAWQIQLEWSDSENISDMDPTILREYVEFFPEEGLGKVIKGYLASDISPFPEGGSDDGGAALENEEAEDEIPPLTAEDILLLMTENTSLESALAHRIISHYFLHIEEHEASVENARKGLKFLRTECHKSGLKLQNSLDALNSTLATSLVHYQTPKNHPEAKAILDEILTRKPQSTPALIGVGLILEEEEMYAEANTFLTKAYQMDKTNIQIGAEAAWCKALDENYSLGLSELEQFLDRTEQKDMRAKNLRAQIFYRIGVCQWELDASRVSRKDRKGSYAMFIASIKANPNFAPAYTMLGNYYADYAKDRKRARQCFQKAFELSSSEVTAAERLARSFADQGEWDIVEIIAQRVVDSGKAKPPPGSKKKKGYSWPYSALGVVQMNKQEYSKSIVSFLAALRINPTDYHSYVGLGESYHNSGRYNSAARTFRYAEEPTETVKIQKTGESWFTKYMLANVNRELGEYDAAVKDYEEVLAERTEEFGVAIALLQTLVERAWRNVQTGLFGQAATSASRAVQIATQIVAYKPHAFNLWKAVGDACAVYSWVQSRLHEAPLEAIQNLLRQDMDLQAYELFEDTDGIGPATLKELAAQEQDSTLRNILQASILAQKRAIHSCAHDVHARAVSWYNLGWTEYRAHACLEQEGNNAGKERLTQLLKASMKCFKRAIELEAGNADFWNALGVVTTQFNPKVAQHSLVRSLHLNERSVSTWTNLGALYLLQDDIELAHQAFGRAQSTDPDYAHAWVGEGLVALLWGDASEALSHFTHAFEISNSASLITKKQYTLFAFDNLLSSASSQNGITSLIQPQFALKQLLSQAPSDVPFRHLLSSYHERTGDYSAAVGMLAELCAELEEEYEASESPVTLSRFSAAKSDLARNLLATNAYEEAAETAETTLDLMSESDSLSFDAATINKIRLSARLTLGLAHHYLSKTTSSATSAQAAISAFRTALEESSSSAEVVCLLATVLWADGGANEKNVARDQLFALAEQSAEHVDAVVLLGAMAVLENDAEALEAVHDDLLSLRLDSTLDVTQVARIEKILVAIAALGGEKERLAAVQRSIVLSPAQAQGWQRLALESEEPFAADMALVTAKRAVPPLGRLDACGLAEAFAGTGRVADVQRSIVLAPWRARGWGMLGEIVS